jgi:D-serine deaminase-like pyridoxal phosphate-dependent protein
MWTRRGFLGSGAAAAVQAGRAVAKADLATPALVVDLDAFEANLQKMAAHVKAAGRGFRPHGKTHKSPTVAKRLAAAGAAGACAAKLGEAEAFAAGGVRGLLVTSAVVGKAKLERALALARRQPDTIFCVDDAANAAEWNAAAATTRQRIRVAIDLWVGRRTGILPGAPAVALAEKIAQSRHLELAGLQAYAGHSSHVTGWEARRKSSEEAMAEAVATRRALEKLGIEGPLLTGGSTGTYNIDTALDGMTELQPGSFLFMDIDYRKIGGRGGALYDDFAPSLFVVCTVISRPKPDLAIVDGGFKAFATDRGYGPEAWRRPDLTYRFAGDEHGAVTMKGDELKVGDRLDFLVPHCDPTVNLYDRMYALRGDRVVEEWAITARGRSQ